MSLLTITDLHVSIDETNILKGIDLSVEAGQLHAVMGPNGSGKSTLAYTLAGHPEYAVTAGDIVLSGESIIELSPDERAQHGLFLAFQYPVEIPGVSVLSFLRQAHTARFKDIPERQITKALAFKQHVEALADELQVKRSLLSRGLNEGFSGGEKKRLEILQMAVLEPTVAILDETDSGLDVDAIRAVANGIKVIQEKSKTAVIVITHYQRILEYLEPEFVHVVVDGKIAKSGGGELAATIESEGYEK